MSISLHPATARLARLTRTLKAHYYEERARRAICHLRPMYCNILFLTIFFPKEYIGTVKLAGQSDGDFSGQPAQASGWGITSDSSQTLAPALRYVISTILTNDQCQTEFGPDIPISSSHICLDGSQGKSTCSVSLFFQSSFRKSLENFK